MFSSFNSKSNQWCIAFLQVAPIKDVGHSIACISLNISYIGVWNKLLIERSYDRIIETGFLCLNLRIESLIVSKCYSIKKLIEHFVYDHLKWVLPIYENIITVIIHILDTI